ncbi:MAG: hypothetical protein J2P44_09770 [Candidatus Dormibacteraeota bacterium]|nr:hypothetical protein [Candidatus Dormibacteraeota bacterium]
MLKPLPTDPPRFYGVTTYADPEDRFKFRVPSNWHREELEDERDGMIWMPDVDDPDTHISCWVQKLEEPIQAEDLEDLRSGVEQGLNQLPNYQVESGEEGTYGNLIKFERVFTYGDPPGGQGVRHKRRSWYLYANEWAIVLAWQGATPEHYEYWLPMGNYAFATFDVAEWLWFATDRDLGFRP